MHAATWPDRIRTALRRSKLTSRATFLAEQATRRTLLHPQVVAMQHRGTDKPEPFRLDRATSLLSPA